MKKIEIIETFGRYKKGQVVTLDDFGVGHALAFKYGKIYAFRAVETQAQVQPEVRAEVMPEPALIATETESEKPSFFKRRGRKPKNG